MNFPFFNRLQVKKITVATTDEAGQRARTILESLLRELPELLLSCVVEVQSGKLIASYTAHSNYNPNHVSLRYARVFRAAQAALATRAWPGGPLTDISVLLDEQLHLLCPLDNGQRYCLLVVNTADTNLALAKDILRRSTE
ncbi:hypothetical protein J7E24_05975 [Hymenobacter sp. ISL-91]|uniref:hypothetical protein n=1 Tax=Hymenobacter sp. ISL-91 TaxID=2819151 RepID=UPI001BECD20C|nr:hypothetical protein [Hymenobacter sp. ISL-91]MBT2557324.1 hypothetical protein [Hymenobacter sp. ISL-91]